MEEDKSLLISVEPVPAARDRATQSAADNDGND